MNNKIYTGIVLDPIDDKVIHHYKELLKDPRAGAIVTFEGVTRNYFEDKQVVTLEYECYHEMANIELEKIANECISMGALKVCLLHREGIVDISETSVLIIVLTSHRGDGFKLCEYSIEQIKKRLPVWKKEVYTNSTHVWKENLKTN